MPELITREEAIARGLKRYYTGIPCKHGHVTERFVSGWLCYGCTDANSKQWVEKNKARKDAVDAAYRQENREALRAKKKARYDADDQYREHVKAKAREWARANPERCAERVKEWGKAHPERIAEHNRKWAKNNPGLCNFWSAQFRPSVRRATPSWADPARILEFYELAAKMTEMTGVPHEVDHVFPLGGDLVSGLHVHENLQILTQFKNRSKRNRMPEEFEMSLVKVIAVDSFDGLHPGDETDVPERQANQLVARGLAKMAAPPRNKMAAPALNKSNPTPAVGEEIESFASPAGHLSPQTTVPSSADGVPVKRGPGRPRKVVASSQ
jgi:hypothetical protein